MDELEYVARVDGPLGPRGTVVSRDAWADLSDSAREDFGARAVREDEPEPAPVEEK